MYLGLGRRTSRLVPHMLLVDYLFVVVVVLVGSRDTRRLSNFSRVDS